MESEFDKTQVPAPETAPAPATTEVTQVLPLEDRLLNSMAAAQPIVIPKEEKKSKLSLERATSIVQVLAKRYNTTVAVLLQALYALYREGAAFASVNKDKGVPVITREGKANYVQIGQLKQSMIEHNTTLRDLGESLAEVMIKFGLTHYQTNGEILEGDMAQHINRIAITKGEQPLTPEEKICCNVWAQRLEFLDDIAQSNRLSRLMQQDLIERQKKNKDNKAKAAENKAAKTRPFSKAGRPKEK